MFISARRAKNRKQNKATKWRQHLIVLFDGTGCVVAKDELFQTPIRGSCREDVNLSNETTKQFVYKFLQQHQIPHYKIEEYGRFNAMRLLGMFKRMCEIRLIVVRVSCKQYASSRLFEKYTEHELCEQMRPLLETAVQELSDIDPNSSLKQPASEIQDKKVHTKKPKRSEYVPEVYFPSQQ